MQKQEDRAPTLADVARLAKVSTATVSRCLNLPDRVVEKTRNRVLAAVDELGYAPNFGAQALAAKRTNTFGAIVPTMENAIFARGLQAFQEELDKDGITLLAASSSYAPEMEKRQIRALVGRGAEALFLIGHDRDPEIYDLLNRRSIPFVVGWVFDPDAPQFSVGFDNRAAMRHLTDEVLKLGHRRLAMITAPHAGNDRARGRYDGIVDALLAHGMGHDHLTVEAVPYAIQNGAEAFRRLMQVDLPPTAVLCGNDVLAVGAVRQAQKMGLDVPGDVSITGFDDIELAEIVQPGLTTVHVPHRLMGQQAARTLIAQSNGTPVGESVSLPVRIVWRDTLGPVQPNTGAI